MEKMLFLQKVIKMLYNINKKLFKNKWQKLKKMVVKHII